MELVWHAACESSALLQAGMDAVHILHCLASVCQLLGRHFCAHGDVQPGAPAPSGAPQPTRLTDNVTPGRRDDSADYGCSAGKSTRAGALE